MSISKWMGWTDWTPLEGFDFKIVKPGPGTYVIATDKPLSRVVGVDPNGILDIGESAWLRSRLKSFYRRASGCKRVAHSAGRRYVFFNLNRYFPLRTLRVRWIEKKTKKEARRMESKLLYEYIEHYHELPPLNAQFTRS